MNVEMVDSSSAGRLGGAFATNMMCSRLIWAAVGKRRGGGAILVLVLESNGMGPRWSTRANALVEVGRRRERGGWEEAWG